MRCTDLLFFGFAGEQVDHYVGNNSHGDTFGNTVHEWHCDDRDKARDRFCHVTEIDLGDRGQHQVTYDDQSRCCRKGRNCQEDRGKQKRKCKQDTCYYGGESCTSAFCNTGGTFDKGGNSGGTAQ